jgi:hypothetical protein
LHRHGHLLAHTGFVAGDQGGEDADQQVHAGVGIAEGRAADGGRSVPEPGSRRGAAGALGHVVIDLEVGPGGVFAEALDRAEDQPRVELVDVLPAQAHAVHRPGGEVLHQHVGVADQLLHDLFALGGLGVDRQ